MSQEQEFLPAVRKARNRLSQMVLECLDGWEEEYEQIRYDDSL